MHVIWGKCVCLMCDMLVYLHVHHDGWHLSNIVAFCPDIFSKNDSCVICYLVNVQGYFLNIVHICSK